MRIGHPAGTGRSSNPPAPGWRSALTCAALLAAVAFAPPALAGALPGTGNTSLAGLPSALNDTFPTWWASQQVHLTTGLQQLVTYWAWFHTLKALTSAALLVSLVWVVVRTWRVAAQAVTTGRARPRLLGTAGAVLAAALTPLALVVVVANIQGALAPLSSVLTFLDINAAPGAGIGTGVGAGGASTDGAAAAAQIRHALLTGTTSPPVQVLVDDFRLYHLVLAMCAGVVCLTLLACVVLVVLRARGQAWRRAGDHRFGLSGHKSSMRLSALRRHAPRARRSARKASSVLAGSTATTLGASDRAGGSARVLVGVSGVLAAGMLAFFALVGTANVSTVASTPPALAEFFSGSGL